MLVGAIVSSSAIVGPPSLPPEAGPPVAPPLTNDSPPTENGQGEGPTHAPQTGDPAPDPGPQRDSLPPGLQPIPFPLENQRRAPAPTDGSPPVRRSIVDLRDPFDRPPPRVRTDGSRDTRVRLLIPDLKDPFAPGVRRIRSKTLEQRIPNDIIDPFRAHAPTGRAACVRTTNDGTVVQGPNKKPVQREECKPSRMDLRDPFDREPGR